MSLSASRDKRKMQFVCVLNNILEPRFKQLGTFYLSRSVFYTTNMLSYFTQKMSCNCRLALYCFISIIF